MELCIEAVFEQDRAKFLALIEEINRLLTEKEERLKKQGFKPSEA
jgi:hypothetical protein